MTDGAYRIKVKGLLDEGWADWFEGWTISSKSDGTTLLTSQKIDQSAFYGMMEKIRNLNLSVLAVDYLGSEE